MRRALCVAALGLVVVPCARAAPVGSWSVAAPMPVPGSDGAAAMLADGRVLVVGGRGANNLPAATAQLYDPASNRWLAAAPLPEPRDYVSAAPLPGDRVLVVGGYAHNGPATSTEIYSAASNSWSAGAPLLMPGNVSVTAAALPGGRVLVSGAGLDGWDTELYDSSTNRWSWGAQGGSLGLGGASTSAALSNGRVVMASEGFGGFSPQEYDPRTNTWSYLPQGLSFYGGGPIGALGGDLVFTLGSLLDPEQVSIFAASQNEWFPGASMPAARSLPTVASLPGGRVLVAGGNENGIVVSRADIFTAPASLGAGVHLGEVQIDGHAVIGSTLAATGGSGAYTYQWQRCTSTCVDVGAPTPSTTDPALYTITAADAGASLQVVATDPGGAGNPSNAVGPVAWPTVQLTYPSQYFAAGDSATPITVERTGTGQPGSVGYRIVPTITGPVPVTTGQIEFSPGQDQAVIWLPPTTDHGVLIPQHDFTIGLSGATGMELGSPVESHVVLCGAKQGCQSITPRDPLNPLELAVTPPASNPLADANLFVDTTGTPVAKLAWAWRTTYPKKAAMLAQIADQPNTERFGKWSGPYPGSRVAKFLTRAAAEEPGSVPLLATYKLVDGHCGGWSDPPADAAAYHDWINSLSEGIGNHPAVLFLEMDSIITAPQCLSKPGITIRMNELHDAINILSNNPHLVTYLDAGAADALKPQTAAHLLKRAGIKQIQGFFLNSTHFDWTKKEIAYGQKISKLTGGKHFVINTAENGQGPERTKHPATQGAEVICNPTGRGLGPKPTTHTGYKHVDAFAWIAHPGISGGPCTTGAPPIGDFWPAKALSLVKHANYTVR